MPRSSLSAVVHHLRTAVERGGGGRTDGELLTQFLGRRDEDALAALVERHAPMVWGVCRRVLHTPHDAEDAFQATFLVLVQKAATVVPRDMVANWLHGVAQQTAVRLRASAAKRGWREVQMDVMPEPAEAEARDEELLSRLDEELSRLPERCRALIVLCDLEGCTRKEVARQLGCPEGTVASGLVRARALLAKRLNRHGLAVSGGSLAATLSHSAASADVPASAVTNAINVATLAAAGKAAGVISGPVATLTQGVVKAMFLKKILTTTMAVLALGVAVITGGSLAVGQTEGKPAVGKDVKALIAEKPMKPAAEVAWGKEKNGLQLGLVRVPGDTTACRPGQVIEFGVRVRNVSKEKITISIGLPESTPTITDASGEKVQVVMPLPRRVIVIPIETVLQPGETFDLHNRKVAVEEVLTGEAEQKGHVGTPTIRVGPGKYKIAFPEFVQRDLVLSTGEIEFEVKDGDEKKQPEQKEPFTAWGKEVGGVQAGLGFKAGEQRACTHGETVTLVLRVRNVGKEEVKFSQYEQEFRESALRVTHDGGKAVPLQAVAWTGRAKRTDVTLAPGKTVDLSEANLALRPVGDKGQETTAWTLFGTGKYQLQCEKVGGSIRDQSAPDSILSKLATGKLELEVKEPEKGPQDKKEAFTAWGKESGGLQAGLGLLPGAKRVYQPGETVTLVVRVRNVGKEAVKFEYVRQFLDENRPTVTNDDGKALPQSGTEMMGIHGPTEVNIEPGKEVVLETRMHGSAGSQFALLPESGGISSTKAWPLFVGTGKVSLHYDAVFGNSSSGKIKLDPDLAKLATGKLELEVKDALPVKQEVLTPAEAVKMAGDSELAKKFNPTKPAVEFKVEFVTNAIQVKASGEKDAAWAHGHSPDDVCLGLLVPNTPGAAIDLVKRDHIRFVATLTAKVIGQLNKAGIDDLEKHFKGKTVRVIGPISRHAYDGFGSPDEVEIVLDDMSQLEVVK